MIYTVCALAFKVLLPPHPKQHKSVKEMLAPMVGMVPKLLSRLMHSACSLFQLQPGPRT